MTNLREEVTPLLKSIRNQGVFCLIARVAAKRPVGILLALYAFGTDWLIAWHSLPFGLMGMVDEPAHVATALVVLGAITRFRTCPPEPKFGWTMLTCSVFIDLDHLPAELGSDVLTGGTPRPYTHALWTVMVLTLAWAGARYSLIRPCKPRPATVELVLAGAAWGLAAHFLRDIATAQMSLWWPITDIAVQLPYWSYVAALLAIIALPTIPCRKKASEQSPANTLAVLEMDNNDSVL